MEGGHAIENSLGALRAYYELGVRYMTLTHNVTLDWADSATDMRRRTAASPRSASEVVREMNRLGMLVDLSHVSPDDDGRRARRLGGAGDLLALVGAARSCDVTRNVPDDVLRAAAEERRRRHGHVRRRPSCRQAAAARPAMAETTSFDAQERPRRARPDRRDAAAAAATCPMATIARSPTTSSTLRRLAGADHVGIGGDYDGNDEWPVGIEDVSDFPPSSPS